MKIIAGLGNPGSKYEFTRHNTGFLMLDYYAQLKGFKINKLKNNALIAEYIHNGEKILFLKPQTFMNLSGEAIRALSDYYKVDNEDILVIYDDISLPLGRMRIRKKGTDGGHNGIKNIIYQLQTDVFPRIKIGVSMCDKDNMIDHVLGTFSKKELEILKEMAEITAKAIDKILADGADAAMNIYNSTDLTKKE